MRWVFAALAIFGAWYFDLFENLRPYTYIPEVGYYLQGKETYSLGDATTHDKCVEQAIARFNNMNAESPDRAFRWSCRKMQGENFLERVK